MRNDLQVAAISLRPQLELVPETGLSFGALGGIVSGSGPTCAFLAQDEEQALDIAAALSGSGMCRLSCTQRDLPMVRRWLIPGRRVRSSARASEWL